MKYDTPTGLWPLFLIFWFSIVSYDMTWHGIVVSLGYFYISFQSTIALWVYFASIVQLIGILITSLRSYNTHTNCIVGFLEYFLHLLTITLWACSASIVQLIGMLTGVRPSKSQPTRQPVDLFYLLSNFERTNWPKPFFFWSLMLLSISYFLKLSISHKSHFVTPSAQASDYISHFVSPVQIIHSEEPLALFVYCPNLRFQTKLHLGTPSVSIWSSSSYA